MRQLKIIGGSIKSLGESSLNINSTNLSVVNLHLNKIETIAEGAFKGQTCIFYVYS